MGHPKGCMCHGTGRLGVEGARRDIQVLFEDHRDSGGDFGWYWSSPENFDLGVQGPFDTSEEALTAARETLTK